MTKSIIFGVVWCLLLYFITCIFVGGVAGGIAGAADPENASVAGAKAGAEVVAAYRHIIFLGAAAVAAVGTWLQMLPGTKRRPSASVEGLS